MKNNIHLQGDISLVPCPAPEISETLKHNGEYVLAYGEQSNHCHVVRVADPEQMVVVKDKNGDIYLQILGEATVSHEMIGSKQKADHGVHTLTPSWYKLTRERIYDYWEMSTRQVQD